jgi:uncharacterized membrane protein
MKERLIPTRSLRQALLALALATGVCLAMIVGRTIFVKPLGFHGLRQRIEFPGFVWNLFLAWIPLLLALLIHALSAHSKRLFGELTACGIAWLLFFPNAPYLVTDLVHWNSHAPIPKWFDLLMIMSFAWTGLLLGYLSLYLMQELVRRWKGRAWSWSFVVFVLAMSSFGIYLGRFRRLNSWDVVSHPMDLLSDVARSADFMRSPETLAFSVTFFAFSFFSYLTLFTLTNLHGAPEAAALKTVSASLPPGEKVR